jgi:phosphatidate cytidylyltransferase
LDESVPLPEATRKAHNIRGSRVRVAAFGLLLFLIALRYDVDMVAFTILAVVLATLGVREFRRLAQRRDVTISSRFEISSSIGLVLLGLLPADLFERAVIPALLLLIVSAFVVQMAARAEEDAMRVVPMSFFGPVYIGLPLALGLQVLAEDRIFLLFGLIAVWMADTGAYVAGHLFGSTRLAPRLSPGKTVEGLIGGTLVCLGSCVLFKLTVPPDAFSHGWIVVCMVGLVTALLAPVGDLAESVLKRDAGVKDSGSAFAGHGGILDRLDSLLFCLGGMYTILRLAGRI